MSFAEPGWLVLLLLVPPLAAGLAVAGWLHRRKLGRVLSPGMLARALPSSVRGRRLLRDAFAVLAFALAVVALAEPRFDKQVRTLRVTGADVVVLLDLSRSMDARDVDPSRLERARRELHDLGQLVQGDRVGLVVFAGGADPRLPLTNDFRALELVVSEARTDTFEAQGSNLAAAIRVGLELLRRSEGPAGQALLVLSDGETHQPDEALAAAREAAEAGVPVFAMGIGVEPSPIPVEGGRVLEWQGKPVSTAPDFEILEQAARLTGGAFVTSNAASRDMQALYAELRGSVRVAEREAKQRETWRSAFQWPLGFAALLLLLSGWLGDGRRAFGGATAALLALGLAGSEARAADLAEADRLYGEGKYAQAAEELVELSLERPDDAGILERLGAARYRAGDFEGAARAFDAAGDGFGSGNAHYQAGRLEDALARYDQVIADEPEHPGALANRDLVVREIEARRARKPPPPPKPGGEKPPDEGEGEGQPKPMPGQQDPQEGEGQGSGQQVQGDPTDRDGQDPQGGGAGHQPQPDARDPDGRGGTSDAGPEDGQDPAVDPSALDPSADGSTPTEGSAPAGPGETGPITAGQAERLLESVEEGSPRVVVQGRPEGKPW